MWRLATFIETSISSLYTKATDKIYNGIIMPIKRKVSKSKSKRLVKSKTKQTTVVTVNVNSNNKRKVVAKQARQLIPSNPLHVIQVPQPFPVPMIPTHEALGHRPATEVPHLQVAPVFNPPTATPLETAHPFNVASTPEFRTPAPLRPDPMLSDRRVTPLPIPTSMTRRELLRTETGESSSQTPYLPDNDERKKYLTSLGINGTTIRYFNSDQLERVIKARKNKSEMNEIIEEIKYERKGKGKQK
jgi:hypothetical protein